MKFIDLFAGIGGFRLGLEMAGHECVGFCEWDKFATASYIAMHLITDKQRAHLETLPLKQRQKEILKEEYRNGEWYAGDIRTVNATDIPKADLWCAGFPCQDISVAGKQLGFDGNRSSLYFQIIRLLEELEEENKPEWLLFENVKNLLAVNRGWDFARMLFALDAGGYDAEWQMLNTKDFGVPQNRERVFIIGHLRSRGRREILPVGTSENETGGVCQQCVNTLTTRYAGSANGSYVVESTKPSQTIKQIGNLFPSAKRKNPNQGRLYDTSGIAPTLSGMGGGNRQPFIFGKNTRIRKLTPLECFRLQGFPDEYFRRAEIVNSDSQLYKQAGNSVTVNVIYELGKKLKNLQDAEMYNMEKSRRCDAVVDMGQKGAEQ